MKRKFLLLGLSSILISLVGCNPTNTDKPVDPPVTEVDETIGTLKDPMTASDAINLIDTLEKEVESDKAYYISGEIKSISDINVNTGKSSFTIHSGDKDLYIYNVLFLENSKIKDVSDLKIGKKVVVLVHLVSVVATNGKVSYKGQNGYIYSVEGISEVKEFYKEEETKPDPDPNPDPDPDPDPNPNPDINIGSGDYTGYYESINSSMTKGMNGTLRTTLTDLIHPKKYYTYSGSSEGCLGSILQEIDEDPKNSNNMIMFYTQKSIKKQASGTWNREHTWPQSLSGGLYGKTGGGCDVLHIRPTYVSTNSARGNLKYGDCPNGKQLSYDGIDYAKTSNGFFEPMDSVKGDCARIVFYMWTCYFATRNNPITAVASSIETMIEWSKLDPVDDKEILRNEKAYASNQKNRNPYVDHPEWIDAVFGK